MTKHDWFWVAVKVAGLVLLLTAGFTLLTMLMGLFGISGYGEIGFGRFLLSLLLYVGVMGVAGVWLIRDGSLLLRWAAAAPGVEPREPMR